MKKFIFACNFKMNNVSIEEYKRVMGKDDYSNVILCPNFCQLYQYAELKKNGVFLGAQNVSEYNNGAYTGETSADMLKSAGVSFCIIGHSERKKYNFETLSQTNLKIKKLIESGITPIVCVGEELCNNETMSQTEYAKRYVLVELKEILQDIDISKVIVAYEPIWAIGTGKVAGIEHIKEVVDAIKKYAGVEFVLYGGSFGESNFEQIAAIDCVDGALIGGASLKPELICKMKKKLEEE